MSKDREELIEVMARAAPRPPVIDGEGSRDDHNNTDPTPPTTEEEGA